VIKPFKLLHGYTYSDEYTIPNLDHPIWRDNPPFGISRRHWNLLPQDLRGATYQEMNCYIQGWEHARINIGDSPYHDRTRTILWNRGFTAYQSRVSNPPLRYRNVNPNPPIDETYPEFYNTDEFIFFDVTEVRYDEETYVPYKQMLFRHIEEGNTIEGDRIQFDHPMYNFPDII